MPTTFFSVAERDFWALRGSGWEQLHDYAERESGHTMRGKRARGHRGCPGPATPARWGGGGGERSQPRGRRVAGRSPRVRGRRWAANGLGVESCGKVLMPLGSSGGTREGAFWRGERLRLLPPQSESCAEPFLRVTLACGSGRGMDGEPGAGCLATEVAGSVRRAAGASRGWAR